MVIEGGFPMVDQIKAYMKRWQLKYLAGLIGVILVFIALMWGNVLLYEQQWQSGLFTFIVLICLCVGCAVMGLWVILTWIDKVFPSNKRSDGP